MGPPIRTRKVLCCKKKALDIGFVEIRMDKWIDEWLDGFVFHSKVFHILILTQLLLFFAHTCNAT